jgi:hypothetical protein
MAEEQFKLSIMKQVGALEQSVLAAHKRLDESNRDLKPVLEKIETELKKVNEHMVRSEDHGEKIETLWSDRNKSIGAKSVWVIIGSLGGGLITAIIGYIFK